MTQDIIFIVSDSNDLSGNKTYDFLLWKCVQTQRENNYINILNVISEFVICRLFIKYT